MAKNNYSNNIRVGCDKVEQIWEGVSGDGLDGNFHRASSRNWNVSTDDVSTKKTFLIARLKFYRFSAR